MNPEKCDNVDYVPHRRPIMGVPGRVRVKGRAGADATVIVTVVHDTVWPSISPPFTWEAIMQPGKAGEVISMLELARDEAKQVATTRNGTACREGKAVIREITSDGLTRL